MPTSFFLCVSTQVIALQ